MTRTEETQATSESVTMKDVEKTVFVVTYGRSGSTLTQRYLNSFPATCIRGENGNLLYHICKMIHVVSREENYIWRRENKELPDEARLPFLRGAIGVASDPWFGAENVNLHEFESSLAQFFFDEIIKPAPGTKTIGFKEIRWADDMGFLSEMLLIVDRIFPNVHFIFQTRNWEEVSRSSWWAEMPQESVQSYVEEADAAFKSFAGEKRKSLLLDYCELTTGIDGFRRIADFIGEKFDEASALSIAHSRLSH